MWNAITMDEHLLRMKASGLSESKLKTWVSDLEKIDLTTDGGLNDLSKNVGVVGKLVEEGLSFCDLLPLVVVTN